MRGSGTVVFPKSISFDGSLGLRCQVCIKHVCLGLIYNTLLFLTSAFTSDGHRARDPAKADYAPLEWVAAFFCQNCYMAKELCWRVEFAPGGRFYEYAERPADFICLLEDSEPLMIEFTTRKNAMNSTLQSVPIGGSDLRLMCVDASESLAWVKTGNKMELWTNNASRFFCKRSIM